MNTPTLTSLQIEGNLIANDITAELSSGELKGQLSTDFGLNKTDKLEDEIAFAWGEIKDLWNIFQRRLSRDHTETATSLTREHFCIPVLKLLGYTPVYQAKADIVDGQTYAISHRADAGNDKPPVHLIGCRIPLDQRPPSGKPRLSAHSLVQEYLNHTEHLWAVVTNGLRWRLLRDCSLMTRSTYVEFDLEQILNGENFAEFRLFYRLFHRSRLPQGMDDADQCLLEFYHQEALQQGGRVRDRLRDGVEAALILLGTGFLQHPDNHSLRRKVDNNELDDADFYCQLLMLVYRLLFLMVAESRGALLSGEEEEKSRIYTEYYSITRLRNLAEQPNYRPEGFQDIWQGLRVTFQMFDENWRGKMLGLSPLNGDLFGSTALAFLDSYAIDNYDLLRAIRELSLYEQKGQLRRVNYGALDVEELGSIYESLLDFSPQISCKQGIYQFKFVAGSDRKTTGSYYTPPALVAQLIKTALEPVIEAKLSRCRAILRKGEAPIAQNKDKDGDIAQLRTQLQEALLSIKICDPACGSGHFLLAAARRLGKELAKVRTGETQPGPDHCATAIRDVIQHCIYGVDLNPLAVDLCKVALWIEGFNRGLPLNFLDHRIKCGNSLVGVLDLDCLKEGIPENAYKAVTGDDKKLATQLKKRNKQELKDLEIGQLPIDFINLEQERLQYAEDFRKVGEIDDKTPQDIKQKQTIYNQFRSEQNTGWWRDYSACNLWTAAFFMPLTDEKMQLLPTTTALNQLLRCDPASAKDARERAPREQGNKVTEKMVKAANQLAAEKRFFHWGLEFPEVFEQGGFDCVLGNPPWERIKLQEKEFFASRNTEIANAQNKAARTRLINQLGRTNPELLQNFEDAKHFAEAQSKFIRESNRFLLTNKGDINTYAVFAETTRNLISSQGRSVSAATEPVEVQSSRRVGVIVPTGIATDDTCKQFFGDLTQKQALASLHDFENRERLFPAVDSRMKFSLLGMSNTAIPSANLSFFLTKPKQTEDKMRVFQLSGKDIELMNPNTLTCPVFRTKADADLTKKIYQRVPVLENEKTGSNPWGISFMRMFDMSNDSHLFRSCSTTLREGEAPLVQNTTVQKYDNNDKLLPLYEAKMFHQFDHRWVTYTPNEKTTDFTDEEKCDPTLKAQPRYWVDKKEVESKLDGKWNKEWLLSFRRICRTTDERTAIFSLNPKAGFGDSVFLMIPSIDKANLVSCLVASLNSIVFDFITRQKMGGTNMSFFIIKQLPVLPPEVYTEADIEFISSRVLELVYTSWDMKPFAEDMGYEGEPFIWNPEKRAIIRAELDAKYAKLYGLTREELRYLLDPKDVYGEDFPSETFRVLKNNETKKYGEYRTQRLVLEAWDRMK
jgi:hypothetical protein